MSNRVLTKTSIPALLLGLVLAASACGGESNEEVATSPTSSDQGVTSAPVDQSSDGSTSDDTASDDSTVADPDTADSEGDSGGSNEYVATGGRVSAGGLTFTAEQCDFPVGALIGADPSKHFDAVAAVAAGVFLTGQHGDEVLGLLKFTQADEPSCRLLPAEGFGSGGVLGFGDPINHVSGGPDGVLLASNSIFGTWVVDAATGASQACGRGSFAEIHAHPQRRHR